jgi:3',5'-cyclic AMP phosphodiesterase CpdA
MLELRLGGRIKQYVQAKSTLSQIVREYESQRAAHLIVSGDLTAYSMEWEFQGAREALGKVGEDRHRCTVIPGNHDRYTPEVTKSRLFEKYFGHLLQSDLPQYCREDGFPFVRLVGNEAAIIGLGSARVPPFPGLSYGVIGRKQLEGLRDAIDDVRLRGRAVLVAVHHAPFKPSGKKDKLSHRLVDAEALFRVIPGRRFAIVHGHIHHRYYHPPTEVRPHIFCAGSSTQKGREGYWLIEVKDGEIRGGVQRSVGGPASSA